MPGVVVELVGETEKVKSGCWTVRLAEAVCERFPEAAVKVMVKVPAVVAEGVSWKALAAWLPVNVTAQETGAQVNPEGMATEILMVPVNPLMGVATKL